ncbi:bifunctional uridylyltransferase/uridylyl-removing enzyme [Thalassotalea insulae]|uniref:Bifunctional uridylyltransferase/uridylyl-removing enzyme n=1 Tax=Thalassotalea insulae TaxID=2056778 RepID=A0ABQ6GUT7_9GAMM|nr:[protein-PII] uridylyltransferase [Thalassotalea insulae]GLX79439.1 bifunctional uridylyltransferase/uridylyl-removing enzyme [Thalassotalea insulae]
MSLISLNTPGTELRQQIAQFDQTLNESFHTDSIQSLMQKRADFFDQLLIALWQSSELEQSPLSLNAVGGYGQKRLHPQSDIDLAIVSDGKIPRDIEQKLSQFLTKLWDLGTDIGHSVRSVKEATKLAKTDITIATNLLDIRPLIGNQNHASTIKEAMFSDTIWTSEKFFHAKLAEQEQRHQKAKNTALYLEPNLKNNPGGMRDVQTIHWIAQKHFLIHNPKTIKSTGFLTSDETSELLESYDFVCRVRWALHSVVKRPQEILLFDYQSEVAKFMRFGSGDNSQQAIESLMGYLFRAMTRIRELNQMLSDSFEFDILKSQRPKPDCVIDDYFVVRNNLLEARYDEVFIDKRQVIRVFLLIAEHDDIKGIAPETLRLLRQTRRRLLGELSGYQGCREEFIKLLQHPNGLKTSLSLMHRYGILASYSSQWKQIEGQMQYDMHNAYTIDEHTFKAVQAIDSFSDRANKQSFIYNINQYIKDRNALILATLCHHIAGKQAVGDNQLNAIIAQEFAENHQIKNSTIKRIFWLVANQELLITTTQSQDITDPEVIKQLAKQVGSVDKLNALYVFTVADMIATNDEYWNEWHECQLKQLYLATRDALKQGIENIFEVRTLIRENKNDAKTQLSELAIDQLALQTLWSSLPNHFFSGNNVEEIVEISQKILNKTPENDTIFISENLSLSSTCLTVYTKDRPKLFVDIFNTLASAKLKVKDAQIMQTKDGMVLEIIKLLDNYNEPITEEFRIKQIVSRVEKAINSQKVTNNLTTPRFVKNFDNTTVVEFLKSSKKNKSLLKVNTLDDPSYMEEICAVFAERELTIHSAKISSLGESTENVFLVSKHDNEPFTDDEKQQLSVQLVHRTA